MTTDFRALCNEFKEMLDYMVSSFDVPDTGDLIIRAIDALAEPLPELPTLPEPVPIGERLPGPEDFNEDGQCWWFRDEISWMLLYTYDANDVEDPPWLDFTHWLPANAIPTPTAEDSSDENSDVRWEVALNPNTSAETLRFLATDKNSNVRFNVARNPNTSTETLQVLATDEDSFVRYWVARNPNTPPEALSLTAEDSSVDQIEALTEEPND